jgi:glycosyltransferase involved in cell wall biosynthesis
VNITILQTEGEIGGAEMCLLDVVSSLRTNRPDWRVKVLLGADGPLRSELEAADAACEVLPMHAKLARLGDAGVRGTFGKMQVLARMAASSPELWGYCIRLRQKLEQSAPDVVQSNGMKAHLLTALAAPRRIPLVWHLHDYLSSRAMMSKLLVMAARRRSTFGGSKTRAGLIGAAVSRSVADDAQKVLGIYARIEPIYNAVDLDRFKAAAADPWVLEAGRPQPPPGAVRVGLVATFANWKGHFTFLEAVAKLDRTLPFRAYIVGGPIYRSSQSQVSIEELNAAIQRLGISDRVVLSGQVSNPARALAALDVVVHASTRPEPFGRVIVEAMACGKAVVASVPKSGRQGASDTAPPASGAAELFTHDVDGFAHLAGDSADLASALDRLIRSPELRDRLGSAASVRAKTHFNRDDLAGKWIPLYESFFATKEDPHRKVSSNLEVPLDVMVK